MAAEAAAAAAAASAAAGGANGEPPSSVKPNPLDGDLDSTGDGTGAGAGTGGGGANHQNQKSSAVRSAGSAAAAAAVAVVAEAEGRARWQAKWHDLEHTLRGAEPRLEALGRAVQVDPIKPTFKVPGIKLLQPKYGKPLSNFAFKFNLRRYSWGGTAPAPRTGSWRPGVRWPCSRRARATQGRDSHSSTFQLNLSRF